LKNYITIIACISLVYCSGTSTSTQNQEPQSIVLGCERMDAYIPLIQNKRVGLVANHSTTINGTHLVDSLLALGVNVVKIFSPEHGFRGDGDAGEYISNQIDAKTGLPVISLYGKRKKPTHDDFSNLDIVIFDMQDVGVRFYTYISTMHYAMETCAEMNLPILVLDRPNPNGFYVDGPVLDTNFRSFVGMHPVPLVHGMTIGEFANMINEEGWLNGNIRCNLSVIACLNYSHDSTYILPVRPSPNLPNQTSIYLYPSLGFFEGTCVSVGRGTDFPFQTFGHPKLTSLDFSFTPESRPGASKNPPLKGEKCYGIDLRDYTQNFFFERKQVNLSWLIFAYQLYPEKDKFFNSYFNLLAGNSTLKKQIQMGVDEETIRESWRADLEAFALIRKKYLLYPDFTLAK
jgi:uncharacterized protein YbbC (DUF1343 family)